MNQYQDFIGELALLHSARQRVADNATQWKELVAAFNAEHAELRDGMAMAQEALDRITDDVRQEALTLWKTIPNATKTSIPGITIRESLPVSYDSDTALAWALDHRLCLKLDDAMYKKLVLAGQAPGDMQTLYTAAIAQDLSPWVQAKAEVRQE